jgi:transcriptional regulator with XRE-family HTH domain
LNSKAFAQWLSEHRRASAYRTQEALARAAGCKKAYISKFESPPVGVSPLPSIDFLAQLSRALGVSIVEPLKAMGYIKQEDNEADPHVIRLVHYYRQLPREDQKLAEELLKTLAKERSQKADAPAKSGRKKIA